MSQESAFPCVFQLTVSNCVGVVVHAGSCRPFRRSAQLQHMYEIISKTRGEFLGRIACTWSAEMRPIVTDVAWSACVCVSVGHNRELSLSRCPCNCTRDHDDDDDDVLARLLA